MVDGASRPHDAGMVSLHIEHDVSDFATWLEVFDSFADVRSQGGVTSVAVRRGVDDRNHVAIDLGFGDAESARAFLGFLRADVWPAAPVLRGEPIAHVLDAVYRDVDVADMA